MNIFESSTPETNRQEVTTMTDYEATFYAETCLLRALGRLGKTTSKDGKKIEAEQQDTFLFILAKLAHSHFPDLSDLPNPENEGKVVTFDMAELYETITKNRSIKEPKKFKITKKRYRKAIYELRHNLNLFPNKDRPNKECSLFRYAEVQNGKATLTIEDYVLKYLPKFSDHFYDYLQIDSSNVFRLSTAKAKGLYIDLKATTHYRRKLDQEVKISISRLKEDLNIEKDAYRSPDGRMKRKQFEKVIGNATKEISLKTDIKVKGFFLKIDNEEKSKTKGELCYYFDVERQRNGTETEPAKEDVKTGNASNQYISGKAYDEAAKQAEQEEAPKDDAGRPIEDDEEADDEMDSRS